MAQLDFTVAEDEFDDSESGLNSVDSSSLYSDDDSLEQSQESRLIQMSPMQNRQMRP